MNNESTMHSKLAVVRPNPRPDSVDALSRLSHVPITLPGATIPTEDLSVRARGTLLSTTSEGRVLTATVAGVISRVNKLIMVRPLRTKYVPETGDVVIGRVIELSHKRWRLDINASKHATLLLSAVNLPGGVQRRRTQADELNMRAFYKEGDLVSAEIQEQWDDGTAALHARSLRYGKLSGGTLITVQAELVKRAKKHFHRLPNGVHAILGNNGFIFLSDRTEDQAARQVQTTRRQDADREQEGVMRGKIARVRNCIVALDMEFVAIGPDTITDVYDRSVSTNVRLEDMTRPDIAKAICSGAHAMRDRA
eukprot:GFKZ01014695.1.p1 GENE.GFKZ01014695.1~~GFKZ01014695.1.p1  ORF type:complete len:309 (-),score=6.98 GFKZ01014695.1:460-1386(-)